MTRFSLISDKHCGEAVINHFREMTLDILKVSGHLLAPSGRDIGIVEPFTAIVQEVVVSLNAVVFRRRRLGDPKVIG